NVEELAHRTYKLGSAGVLADSFPGLPAEGLTVTCDRKRALAREDIQFLTWDHPLVTGALDLLLGSEKGNSSFAQWPDDRSTGLSGRRKLNYSPGSAAPWMSICSVPVFASTACD